MDERLRVAAIPFNSMSPIISTDDVSLGPGEAAMAPATVQKPLGGPAQRLPTSESVVRCEDGVWDDCEGMLLVTSGESPPVTLKPGDVVGGAWMPPRDWQEAMEAAGEGKTPLPGNQGLPEDTVRRAEQDEPLNGHALEVEPSSEESCTMLRADMGEMCAGTAPDTLGHQPLTEILAAVLTEIAAMKAMVEPSVKSDVLIEAAILSEAMPQEHMLDSPIIDKEMPNRQKSEDKP